MKITVLLYLEQGIAPRASGDREDSEQGGVGVVVETAKPKLKPPAMYRVLMLNDDFTPMEFVVEVLEGFFNMGREQATQVMLQVHYEGQAVCGVYPRDIAETRATQVIDYAREHQHPLMCQVEAVE